MNKKGFTLVELLAVIVLLGVVGAISIVSINGVTQGINKSMLEKKIAIVEEAAIIFGEDYKGSVRNSKKKYTDQSGHEYECMSVKVSDLVPDYLDKDNENRCIGEPEDETPEGCVVNPSSSNEFLDDKEIIIFFKNSRIHAILDMDDELSCVKP